MTLQAPDRDLVARDPVLPGLAMALDAAAVAARLGAGPLVPRYLRYKPGVSCVAQFDDGASGIIFRAVDAARFEIYRQRAEWQDRGVVFLSDLLAVALPGRFDRAVKGARRLLDPARQAGALANLFDMPDALQLRVLRHKPGRRLVLRIDRDGAPFALLKAVTAAEWPGLLAGARAAEARGGPRIVAHDARKFMLAQRWIDGEVAHPARADGAAFRAIGAALAAVHGEPAADSRDREAGRRTGALAPLLALRNVAPDLSGPLRALEGELRAGHLARNHAATAFCHGDFSADQVVLTEKGPTIIDWDRAGPGDPLGDLGSFLAALDMQVATGEIDAPREGAAGKAFLDGYRAAGGVVPAEALAFHHAAALAALAMEPFRQRQPDWHGRTRALLERAAALVEPYGLLARAMDRAGMGAALGASLGRPLHLDPPELLRLRKGRRALVAYHGRFADGDEFDAYGKLVIRKPDARTPAVHDALRAALEAAGVTRQVSVPEVQGRLPDRNIWLQRRVEGTLLSDILRPGGDPTPLRATGAALAHVHRVGPVELPGKARIWTMPDEIGVLDAALAQTARARPDLASRLARLGEALARAASALPAPTWPTGIHRDFYPDQAILGPERVWILDLDLYSHGDPAIDIANFTAHLREAALRLWADSDALAAHAAAFVEGYVSVLPLPPRDRLDLLERVALARHAWISLRVEGREHVTDPLVDLCEQLSLPTRA